MVISPAKNQVLGGLRPRLLFRGERSRNILLPHVNASIVHGTVGLSLVPLILCTPLASAGSVTPAMALKATWATRGVVAFQRTLRTCGPKSRAMLFPYDEDVGPMGATLACPTGGIFDWGV